MEVRPLQQKLGVTPQDFATTLASLERLCADALAAAAPPKVGALLVAR